MSQAIFTESESRMKKSVETLQHDLAKLRTGRAHPTILDTVMVPYYGSDVPLNQVANVVATDARNLSITPWEKQMIGPIEKAIMAANLGFTPTNLGEIIKISLPPLTEERRRDLTKVVRQDCENAKVAIRNIRRDANNALKDALKAKTINEDEERRSQETIQKLTDKFIVEIDKIMASKEADLMSM